jgi:hypothetical protein
MTERLTTDTVWHMVDSEHDVDEHLWARVDNSDGSYELYSVSAVDTSRCAPTLTLKHEEHVAAPADSRTMAVARALAERDGWEQDECGPLVDLRYMGDAAVAIAALDAVGSTPRAYIDNDGDRWEEQADGTFTLVRGDEHSTTFANHSLEALRSNFGPLEEIK